MPRLIPARHLLVALACLAPQTRADSWVMYQVRRYDSPNGRHALVIDGREFGFCDDPPAPILVVRRPAGSPPPAFDEPADTPEELLDDGDVVVATTATRHAPGDAFVLDDGRFVLVDAWGPQGGCDLLGIHAADGAARHVLGPSDLFDEATWASFPRSSASVWWNEDAWVDAAGNRAILLATGAHVRVVSLQSGAVLPTPLADVLLPRIANAPDAHKRTLALQVAILHDVPGLTELARSLIAAEDEPLALRIRAATLVHRAGDAVPREVLEQALASVDDGAAAAWAWRHVIEFLGPEAALPRLVTFVRGELVVAKEAWSDAQIALVSLGEPAREALVEAQLEAAAAGDEKELKTLVSTLDELEFCSESVRRIPLDRSLHVLAVAGVPLDFDQQQPRDVSAWIALAQGDAAGLEQLLLWRPQRFFRMERRTSPFALAALEHLRRHPRPDAGELLVRSLEQTLGSEHVDAGWKDALLARTRAALGALTGEDHGLDVEAWRSALGR